MSRTKLILPPPAASEPHHRELAMGIHAIWTCALHAAGANVFAPSRPLDPDLDPFAAVPGMRGMALMHDGAPFDETIDAIVLAELSHEGGGWRCRARILRPDGGEIVLPGWRHRKLSGPLDCMTATLHAIAGALDLDLPETIGWRQLVGARTVAAGIEALYEEGRAALHRGGLEPAVLLH